MAEAKKTEGGKGKGKKKARFITPPNRLKEKVGDGGISEALLIKSQEFIENNTIKFEPIAQQYLAELKVALKAAKANPGAGRRAVDAMIRPIMQLKANGGMFRYHLVSHVANIVLQFLEKITVVDRDVCDIVEAHNNCLTIVITNNLRGDGGREGAALVKELQDACARYYKKHGPPRPEKSS